MSADLHLAAVATADAPPAPAGVKNSQAPQRLDAMADAVRYELAPLIRAAQMLADFQRVHAAFALHASMIPAFEVSLQDACQSWQNPTATSDGAELQDLLRAADNLCRRIVEEAEQ